MAARVRAFDWSRTPLGPMDHWPQSLKTAVSICLGSRFPMMVWWGPELINIYNDAFVPVLGGRHPRALGMTGSEVWTDTWPVIGPKVAKVMEEGGSTLNERVRLVYSRHGYPEETWFTWSFGPIRDESGRVGGLFNTCHEDTQQVLAEAALRESERRFRALVNASADVVYRMSPDWSEMRQLDGRGFIADTGSPNTSWVNEYIHPDDQPRVAAAIREAVRTKGVFELEHRVRRVDGTLGWTFSRAVPLLDADGEIAEWIGAASDVTSRKRAEEALREGEERLRAVFAQTEAGIAQVDLTGRFVLANERYTHIVGRPREQLLNLRMQDITHPDDLPENVALFRQALEDGQPFVIEKRYVRPDGSDVWVSNSVSVMRDRDGRPSGVIAATVDITDRRRAEEALRQSEAHTRRIIDNTLAFVSVLAPDGTVVESNAAALRAGALAREDVVGRPFWDCYWWSHDADVQAQLRDAAARAARGEVVRYDVVVRMAGDARVPIDFMLAPMRGDDGQLTHLIASGMDIADRVRAEEEVRRSQRQLASIVDNTPSAIFIKDVGGRYLLVNAPFERMAGVPVGSMTGKTDGDLFPPEVAAHFRDEDERIAQSREPMTFEETFEFKGERLTFVTNKFPLRNEAGELYAVCGIATDVTALKRAEAAVRESEQRLRLGLRAGRTGTWDWDVAADRVVWSEQLYEIHGLRPEEFGGTGEDFARLVHPDDAERVRSLIQRSLHEGEPYEVEFRTTRPTGEVRWLFTTGRVTRDDAGRPVRMMGAAIDVTDRKRAEAERERLLESERAARVEAERAGRMKDEFLATLSHELRTPLNAILGWSQILAGGSHDAEELAEGLRVIERNARAQTRIIEDLLDMSRIISGKVRLDVQRVDLAPVVQAAVETVRPAAEAKGIRLQAVLDPQARPVSGDPNRLQQVFWNLLTNAVKFTPRGGRIQVLLERVNSHLEVSVIDTGEGIRPEFLPYLFGRFRQADAGTTRRHGGLGLGLSIVKHLVELHGGAVRAKSGGEGQGSTFTVSLPLTVIHADPSPEAERRHPDAPSVGGLGMEYCPRLAGLRVLVVDDEADARALIKRLLEDCDAAVRTAGSAEEAMELIQSERPDVLISDIGMPVEDGYSLIKRVRALGSEQGGKVPALALTAYARSEDRMRAIGAGYQMHVAKPVEPAELIMMVGSLAGRSGQGT